MGDPVRVRFPCQHGILYRHMVKPVGVKPVWCEGGETKLLEKHVTKPMVEEGTWRLAQEDLALRHEPWVALPALLKPMVRNLLERVLQKCDVWVEVEQ